MDDTKHNTTTTDRPKLLDQVRAAIRTRHYSIRTEEAYVQWIKRFILFHNKRHPNQMGDKEISEFLSHLAIRRNGPKSFPKSLRWMKWTGY